MGPALELMTREELPQITGNSKQMKRVLVFTLIGLCFGTHVFGANPPQPRWVTIFNSKDLSSWKVNGDEKWVVPIEPSRRAIEQH